MGKRGRKRVTSSPLSLSLSFSFSTYVRLAFFRVQRLPDSPPLFFFFFSFPGKIPSPYEFSIPPRVPFLTTRDFVQFFNERFNISFKYIDRSNRNNNSNHNGYRVLYENQL